MPEKNAKQLEEYLYVGLAALFDPNMQHPGAARFRSLVRGWQRERYIMMDWPSDEDKLSPVRLEKPCVIQFFNRGRACAFNTNVLDLGSSRQPCLRIEWPNRVEIVAIRQHERAPVNVPCWMTAADGVSLAGILKDISAGGCGVLADVPMKKGEQLSLRFALNKVTSFENVEAVVRSLSPVTDGTILGLQFVNMSEVVADQMELFVAMALGQLRSLASTTQRVLFLEGASGSGGRIREQLEANGHDVTTANNLVDGFHLLKIVMPDLIIIRQEIPEMTGDAICKLIRKAVKGSELPILIIGADNATAKRQCEEAGANGYFPNPDGLVTEALRILKEAAPSTIEIPGGEGGENTEEPVGAQPGSDNE